MNGYTAFPVKPWSARMASPVTSMLGKDEGRKPRLPERNLGNKCNIERRGFTINATKRGKNTCVPIISYAWLNIL